MATILVTDGEQRTTLAVVRSLGRSGHRVDVCASRPSLAGASRYAHAELRVPDPLERPEEYADALAAILHRQRPDVLLPITEASLLSLLPLAEAVPEVRVPFPAVDAVRAVCNKTRVFEAARGLGIAVPKERVLRARDALDSLDFEDLRGRLVIKPSRSLAAHGTKRSKLSVRYAADRADLERVVAQLPDAAFPLHLQERVSGAGVGLFLLLWDGEELGRFSHRRIREKPPSGGVSVYRESIPADPELVRQSRRLLERFDWRGVAMVEYKLDAKTGLAYLMEVNGRFWGSLQLAIDAGVDFPRLLVEAALGERPTPVTTYREGVRSRWLWGDVDHLLTRLRHSNEKLALAADAPGRGGELRAFLAAFRNGRNEVFRRSDPRPAVRETWQWLLGR